MKQLYRTALLAALGLAGVTMAHATPNDIVVGFTASGTPTDYVIDVGNLSGVTGTIDLSSDLSQSSLTAALNAASSASSTLNFGALGGNATGLPGQDVFSSGPGTMQGQVFSATAVTANNVNGIINTYGLVAGGPGATPSSSDATSFTSVAGNLTSTTGVTPSSAIPGAPGTLTLDLFENVDASVVQGRGHVLEGNWNELGYFTVEASATTPSEDELLYTSLTSAVPEPATYGVIGGAGLLVLALRRQFRRVTA